mmetsp:Transcript_2113/g.6011  ORF Transcript_2113/g.6011 Transcript_2113/m.6011 type:complete len:242 (-) Transcript_2113:323-1048(-)
MQSLHCNSGLLDMRHLDQGRTIVTLAIPRLQHLTSQHVAVLREHRSDGALRGAQRKTLDIQVVHGLLLGFSCINLRLCIPDGHSGGGLDHRVPVHHLDDPRGLLHRRHLDQSRGIDRLMPGSLQDATSSHTATRGKECKHLLLGDVQGQAFNIQVVARRSRILARKADLQHGSGALRQGAVQYVDGRGGSLDRGHANERRTLGRVLIAENLHLHSLARVRERSVQLRLGDVRRQALDVEVV